MWNVSISVSMSEVVKAKASTSGTKANAWTLESKVSSPKDKTKKNLASHHLEAKAWP